MRNQTVAEDQPKPVAGTADVLTCLRPIAVGSNRWEPLYDDLTIRAQRGLKKYGTTLETHNGRIADLDLYQELCDAVMYAMQGFLEATERQEIEDRSIELVLFMERAMVVRNRLVKRGVLV